MHDEWKIELNGTDYFHKTPPFEQWMGIAMNTQGQVKQARLYIFESYNKNALSKLLTERYPHKYIDTGEKVVCLEPKLVAEIINE